MIPSGRHKKRVRVVVEGRVQGVFFRARTRETALGLGLCGWVRNRQDGSVEAVFEGEEEALAKVVAWCRRGPPGARVDRLLEHPEAPRGEPGFRIIYH